MRAIITGVRHDAFAGRALSHQGLAAARSRGCGGLFFFAGFGIIIRRDHADRCGAGNLRMLERRFQLSDLAQGARRAGAGLALDARRAGAGLAPDFCFSSRAIRICNA